MPVETMNLNCFFEALSDETLDAIVGDLFFRTKDINGKNDGIIETMGYIAEYEYRKRNDDKEPPSLKGFRDLTRRDNIPSSEEVH
jgi:hypothetical protein